MKIAIFGGSFNPVHSEHINIVKAAKRTLSPDKLIIMPSHITPNKSGRMAVTDEDRVNMCRLAFSGVGGIEVSDYEITKGGVSYSYLTCRALKEEYPQAELYFIIGGDMLENFPFWKNPEEILKCTTLAVCARENEELLKKAEREFISRFNTEIIKIGYTGGNISSTRIRVLAALGESVEGYTDEKTAKYIKEHALYRIDGIEKVKQYLTPERWQHTVRVAVMSAENCARVGVDEKSAITAAALHDCAKYLKHDSPLLAGFACPESVPPPVIHQYTGAYVAEHSFGINDRDILDAIRYHTSGKENMTSLGKLLFLCDMLEEGRNFEGVKKLREIFSHSMDDALFASLKHQIDYLKSAGKPIYPLSLRAYEYLKENRNGQ